VVDGGECDTAAKRAPPGARSVGLSDAPVSFGVTLSGSYVWQWALGGSTAEVARCRQVRCRVTGAR